MRVLELRDGFGIGCLTEGTRPVPEPGPGEVLIRIEAVSLNARDIAVIGGARPYRLPLIPVSDGAGRISAVGQGVADLVVGDRVAPIFVQGWHDGPLPEPDRCVTLGGPADGVLAEYGVWSASEVVKVPDHLTAPEAACLPCAGVSAWNALYVAASVKPGDAVVVQGTGGVSLFALLFAKLGGAEVVLLSGSDAKLRRGRDLGADHAINYARLPEWGQEVRKRLGRGADLVVDIGGAASLRQSFLCLRAGGQVSSVGFMGGVETVLDMAPMTTRALLFKAIRVGSRASFEAMNRAIAQHRLRPVIDSIHPLSAFHAALAKFEAGGHFGKICISLEEAG